MPAIIFLFATGVEVLQYFRLAERLGLTDNRLLRTGQWLYRRGQIADRNKG